MSGFIYKITSPENKSYIGQVVEYISNGEKKGINGRWKQHVNNSKKKDTYFSRAIIKYGYTNFKIEQLMKCKKKDLDLFEELFIKTHNTLVPNGYNLQTGGTNTIHSRITCQKRSNSLKKMLENPEKREIWSKAKKGKIQKNKRKCKNEINQQLPKYIYYKEWSNHKYTGYVVEHPNIKNKSKTKVFSKSTLTLEEKLTEAKIFLQNLILNTE